MRGHTNLRDLRDMRDAIYYQKNTALTKARCSGDKSVSYDKRETSARGTTNSNKIGKQDSVYPQENRNPHVSFVERQATICKNFVSRRQSLSSLCFFAYFMSWSLMQGLWTRHMRHGGLSVAVWRDCRNPSRVTDVRAWLPNRYF
jgi:hypothetical protein